MRPIAIVTGGATGIGAATVRKLALAGYRVVFTYHQHQQEAQLLEKEMDGCAILCDIRSESQIQDVVAKAAQLGSIEVLVCNAGITGFGQIQDLTSEQIQEVLSVNTIAPMLFARETAPHMIRQKKGSIAFVSSMWGLAGASCEALYSSSKSALIGLTKSLAKELGPSGITVNCICPGLIDTQMNAMLSEDTRQQLVEEIPLGRIGSPEEVADAVLFLISSTYITGQSLLVDGGSLL